MSAHVGASPPIFCGADSPGGWTCPPQVGGHAPGTEQCFACDSLHVCVCVCVCWVGGCLVCVSVCAVFYFYLLVGLL